MIPWSENSKLLSHRKEMENLPRNFRIKKKRPIPIPKTRIPSPASTAAMGTVDLSSNLSTKQKSSTLGSTQRPLALPQHKNRHFIFIKKPLLRPLPHGKGGKLYMWVSIFFCLRLMSEGTFLPKLYLFILCVPLLKLFWKALQIQIGWLFGQRTKAEKQPDLDTNEGLGIYRQDWNREHDLSKFSPGWHVNELPSWEC